MQDGFPVVNDDQDGTQDADLGFQGTAQDVVVCSEHSSSPPHQILPPTTNAAKRKHLTS